MKNKADYIIVVYGKNPSWERCRKLEGFIFLTAAVAICFAALKVYETERVEMKNG